MQEWKARGPAAALTADLGAPVLDPRTPQVLTAEEALGALPHTALTIQASISDDVTIGLAFKPWVRIYDVDYQGVIGVMTDGMRRFGLPELRMGPASPDLRAELTTLLNGVAFRIWSDLLARAQETPNAAGLLNLPRFLRVPAEMDIHRRDLDQANGVPNLGGMYTTTGLDSDPGPNENPGDWLTVCPPASWDMSWEDFVADTCHAMFGFEKPRRHCIPEFGALLDALARATQPCRKRDPGSCVAIYRPAGGSWFGMERQTPTSSGGRGSIHGRTPNTRSSATSAGNSHRGCGQGLR